MPALFLALLTAALGMAGGRTALLVARLSGALGGGAGLLAACWITAAATSALAAWAGSMLAPLMPPAGKTMFVAAALAVAALELLFAAPRRTPAEPTRSLGAIGLVLFAGQLTDSARFLVLALAVATGAPALAAVGGTLGTGAVLTAGWALGTQWEKHVFVRTVRFAAAALFGIAAVLAALAARGIIG
ncbi:hypothetical protein GRI75_10140 [Altererythrobacter soli]|uniref:GDT1 family protein n=1 Tax=Croceibacterium soli TaxID=1739690 RepID=A0A6I4UW71_9SPHN|nr:hypothetical protein [Croceibacterium soli]MXP41999.1 hypothetical protein [Croceibacterium soli]